MRWLIIWMSLIMFLLVCCGDLPTEPEEKRPENRKDLNTGG